MGNVGGRAGLQCAGPPPTRWHTLLLAPVVSSPNPAATTTAAIRPRTQPRTVRNFVHSACTSCANPSGPGCWAER
jgi:hypothetical protein